MAKLVSTVAKREGKKTEVSIGNVREVLKVLTDVFAEEYVACDGEFDKRKLFLEFSEMCTKKVNKLEAKKKKAEKQK